MTPSNLCKEVRFLSGSVALPNVSQQLHCQTVQSQLFIHCLFIDFQFTVRLSDFKDTTNNCYATDGRSRSQRLCILSLALQGGNLFPAWKNVSPRAPQSNGTARGWAVDTTCMCSTTYHRLSQESSTDTMEQYGISIPASDHGTHWNRAEEPWPVSWRQSAAAAAALWLQTSRVCNLLGKALVHWKSVDKSPVAQKFWIICQFAQQLFIEELWLVLLFCCFLLNGCSCLCSRETTQTWTSGSLLFCFDNVVLTVFVSRCGR